MTRYFSCFGSLAQIWRDPEQDASVPQKITRSQSAGDDEQESCTTTSLPRLLTPHAVKPDLEQVRGCSELFPRRGVAFQKSMSLKSCFGNLKALIIAIRV